MAGGFFDGGDEGLDPAGDGLGVEGADGDLREGGREGKEFNARAGDAAYGGGDEGDAALGFDGGDEAASAVVFLGDFGVEAVGTEHVADPLLVFGVVFAGVGDEGFFLELREGEGTFLGEAMVDGDGGEEPVADDLLEDEASVAGAELERDEGDVDLAELETFGAFNGGEVVQGDADAGAILREDFQGAGEELDSEGGGVADAELAAFALGEGLDGLHGLLGAEEDGAGFAEEEMAGFGEGDRFGGAAEEFDAKFFLEIADLAAEGRLGDVEALGGAGDVLFLGHDDEVAEVPEFHGREYIGKAFSAKA